MNKKYQAEREEIYSGFDIFTGKPCLITFERYAACTINTEWRYSQYWTHNEWPIQAMRDCNTRIENCLKDLVKLLAVREKLREIEADMKARSEDED